MKQNNFLELKNISKSFENNIVIDNLNLSIKQGSMVTLLGPSGCGKTTILRLIAGLDTPTTGQIFLAGEDITKSAIQQRDIGIVFQSYALFPHMSVGENVGYGLLMQGINAQIRKQRIKEALELVDLGGFEKRYVDQISGGQQQRVALARALVMKPKVLLFDEPLSNLDTNLRHSMREKIRELQQQLNITSLYITHDQSEAFAVSDEVVIMNKGRIIQQATAAELYQRPNSLFTANFMGESSIFDGELRDGYISINQFCFTLPNTNTFGLKDGKCLVGIRPEAVKLTTQGPPTQRCQIQKAMYMGCYWEIIAQWNGKPLLIKASPDNFDPQIKEAYIHLTDYGVFLLAPNN